MKFAIVLILALAIIQYLEIGDALTGKQITGIKERMNFAKNKTVLLKKMIHDTMRYLNAKMALEIETVSATRENTLEIIKGYATFTGKTGNAAARKCIELAEQLLISASNDFFQKFNENFKFQNEREPRVEKYRNLINEFQSVLLKFEEILNGNSSSSVGNNYRDSYNRFQFLAKKVQSKRKIFDSKVNEQIKYEYSVLETRVQNVILTGTECIDQA